MYVQSSCFAQHLLFFKRSRFRRRRRRSLVRSLMSGSSTENCTFFNPGLRLNLEVSLKPLWENIIYL